MNAPRRTFEAGYGNRGAPSMGNSVTVPHGIRLVRPLPALEPFVRYYGHRNARLGDTVVVHPVHARAAPILDFKFGDAALYIPADSKPPLVSLRMFDISNGGTRAKDPMRNSRIG